MPSVKSNAPKKSTRLKMLGFFYPIHYKVGMELERRTCQGSLSRQQVAILWLIESEAGRNGWMRRKDIETTLSDWFESKNPHVSMLLKELSSPPLSLVVQKTNPQNGREKILSLTDAGRARFDSMIADSLDYFKDIFGHLTDEELTQGIQFLQKAFGPPTLGS